ncbi:raffinose/stachyose/melibiose transport system substrate-binding protein [Rathayibacter sp. PhB152]|uniref:ABC transporter substrate-binding protein n=1 Tax=Rathayibacter sp. PhB152 TaxID=2485190 RepID=UPI000F4B33C3|nr:extracellular solute-binding protein [Rathayibacter sp. PhB152]ROQ52609.1 raffinose/stachyose/melibiose transport system substrate-binding protein [Rathayibacter sp. PhB152]
MPSKRTTSIRISAAVALGVASALALTGCSGSSETSGGSTEITWLIEGGDQPQSMADATIAAFQKENPDITVKVDTRPGGTEGDNLIKTRLSTGDIPDLFSYNTGSLLQALNPDQTLTDLSDEAWVGDLTDGFKTVASGENGLYGAPIGTGNAGGIAYSKKIYEELGLSVPTSWDEFVSNSEAIKAAGTAAPVIQSYGDTWTSQLMILADFANVTAVDSDWAQKYTDNEAKYADEPAFASWQHLQDVADAGLFNEDFASATFDDAAAMLSDGSGAQYPTLSFIVANLTALNPDTVDDIGFFAIPADNADDTTLTLFEPAAVYVPKGVEGAELEATKKFVAFINSPEGCTLQGENLGINGPFSTSACALPDDVPTIVSDIQTYVDAENTGTALEFLSPIKGPNLENIAVEVGSGISDAAKGAATYDDDVKKQAEQLGLEGW